MAHSLAATRSVVGPPAAWLRSAPVSILGQHNDSADSGEVRPVRVGGAPLAGVQAVELYRRTQYVLDDVLVARLDLIA